jgi:RNA polymerase sigma-70 factor (ECF subfamily)
LAGVSGRPATSSGATDPPSEAAPRAAFATTHWSAVIRAGNGDTTRARAALEKLCETYWYPLYAHVRRRGHLPEDAKDLTQAFFLRLLEQGSLANADPKLGRFRSFMLGGLDHFLISEWKKARAEKRGGGRELLSLDWAAAERRFDLEPADRMPPDNDFDRRWATALLDEVLKQLESEYAGAGNGELFRSLKGALAGRRETQPYAQLAGDLAMSEAAVKVAVHRLRKRYRALLQAEIGRTVNSAEEAREELEHLFRVLGGVQ